MDLIVTYDPMKTGIVGCLAKIFTGARLIVEINGVYDSPVVWEESGSGVRLQIKKFLVPRLIRFVLNQANGIKLLFPKQMEGYRVHDGKKVIRSYFDWINTDLFVNLGERKEILFAGFPYRIKGVDILIKAFKCVSDRHPDWKLKILGWYPDKKQIKAEINGHPRIFHHPPVPIYEMPEHIGKCGFFVLPSRTEAMGRVLVEAMAAGKARIGSRVDGIPTVIEDGVDGFLVESENVADLAEKMDLLMGDDKLRNSLGNASAVRAAEAFSARCYVRSTLMFYDQVLAS